MGIGKKSHEIVVEHVTSTVITDDIMPEWLGACGIVEVAINDGVEGMQEVLDFLEEFKEYSDRKLGVQYYAIEPRSCGSCHMLTGNYGNNRHEAKNLKCVYENGPEFDFGSVTKWFKLCEHYVRRTD